METPSSSNSLEIAPAAMRASISPGRPPPGRGSASLRTWNHGGGRPSQPDVSPGQSPWADDGPAHVWRHPLIRRQPEPLAASQVAPDQRNPDAGRRHHGGRQAGERRRVAAATACGILAIARVANGGLEREIKRAFRRAALRRKSETVKPSAALRTRSRLLRTGCRGNRVGTRRACQKDVREGAVRPPQHAAPRPGPPDPRPRRSGERVPRVRRPGFRIPSGSVVHHP